MTYDRQRAVGAVLGTFAGDALGARWEGAPPVAARTAAARVERSAAQRVLTYTDDTQLALALAEHLVEHPRIEPEQLARTFLDHHEPGRGYGAGMLRLVELWRSGVPVDEAATGVFPDGSFGNGAAMRVAPVGVRWAHDPDVLDAVARRQARVTHVHPLGEAAAALQARAVGLACARGRFAGPELAELARLPWEPELARTLRDAVELEDTWRRDGTLTLRDVARVLGNEVTGQRSVPAALWAASVGADLAGTVQLTLGLGGDADTISAMAGAVVGATVGPDGIPSGWLDRLEAGPRGRDHAVALAERLVVR